MVATKAEASAKIVVTIQKESTVISAKIDSIDHTESIGMKLMFANVRFQIVKFKTISTLIHILSLQLWPILLNRKLRWGNRRLRM